LGLAALAFSSDAKRVAYHSGWLWIGESDANPASLGKPISKPVTPQDRARIKAELEATLRAILAEMKALNQQFLRSDPPPTWATAQYRELTRMARETRVLFAMVDAEMATQH
jgi:hypothetical protein